MNIPFILTSKNPWRLLGFGFGTISSCDTNIPPGRESRTLYKWNYHHCFYTALRFLRVCFFLRSKTMLIFFFLCTSISTGNIRWPVSWIFFSSFKNKQKDDGISQNENKTKENPVCIFKWLSLLIWYGKYLLLFIKSTWKVNLQSDYGKKTILGRCFLTTGWQTAGAICFPQMLRYNLKFVRLKSTDCRVV